VARPRHSFGRRGGQKRLTEWIGPADQGYLSVASAGATLIGFGSFETSATIVRTRGMVSIRAAVSAGLDIIGAIGVGIVSTEAFTAGIASVPEPFSDADWGGWYVWRSFSYRFDSVTQVGVFPSVWDFEVDSKAMRKIGSNETLVIVAESQAGAYFVSAPLRTLVKIA